MILLTKRAKTLKNHFKMSIFQYLLVSFLKTDCLGNVKPAGLTVRFHIDNIRICINKSWNRKVIFYSNALINQNEEERT